MKTHGSGRFHSMSFPGCSGGGLKGISFWSPPAHDSPVGVGWWGFNTHPNSRLEELLPDRWRQLQEAEGRNVTREKRTEWRKRDREMWMAEAA
ncbi:MAG: hypothetical protein DVB23_003170 [Verrucomicrobia bacterium]|nr:MAG: hypothetical protein DVB23_003170 [Verrucomicrobiota bacterium]